MRRANEREIRDPERETAEERQIGETEDSTGTEIEREGEERAEETAIEGGTEKGLGRTGTIIETAEEMNITDVIDTRDGHDMLATTKAKGVSEKGNE